MPETKPDQTWNANEAQAHAVEISQDVYAGTLRLRECGRKYLPSFPLESPDSYGERLRTAAIFNAYKRTVDSCVGMVLRREPELGPDVGLGWDRKGNTPEHWENIDGLGTHGSVLAAEILRYALVDGHCGVFVTMPKLPKVPFRNLHEQNVANHRPYWCVIRKMDVLRFDTQRVGALTRLSYIACRSGRWGVIEDGKQVWIRQVWEYALTPIGVAFKVWECTETQKGDYWAAIDDGMMDFDRIPLAVVYGRKTGLLTSEPPLLDLALTNLKHYQLESDFSRALHMSNSPTLVTTGGRMDGVTLAVGPNTGLALPEGADAKYIETTGAALGASRETLKDLEQRMASLGLSILGPTHDAGDTATARRIDKAESDSALASIARSLQDCLEEALGFHAEWIGEKGGSITIARDFERHAIDPALLQQLRAMTLDGSLSLETFLTILESGGILPEGFDRKAELARLAAQPKLGRFDEPLVTPPAPKDEAPKKKKKAKAAEAKKASEKKPETEDEPSRPNVADHDHEEADAEAED